MVRSVTFDGLKVILRSGVYPPNRSSLVLLRGLFNVASGIAIDVGCGSGVLSMGAARRGFTLIVASDLSYRAVKTAKENSALNGLSWAIDHVVGDSLSFFRRNAADLIVFNPPMTPSIEPVPLYTWGGRDGAEVVRRVMREVDKVLKRGGTFLFTLCSTIGNSYVDGLESMGYSVTVIDYYIERASRLIVRRMNLIRELRDASLVYINGMPHIRVIGFSASKRELLTHAQTSSRA